MPARKSPRQKALSQARARRDRRKAQAFANYSKRITNIQSDYAHDTRKAMQLPDEIA